MKFLDCVELSDVTSVYIEHMGRTFEGISRLHPDDVDKKSSLIGGKYAEIRATIAALRYERKIAKEECEAIRKFVKMCEQYKGFDKESSTAKSVYRQLNKRIKKVNDLTDEINELYNIIDYDIKHRDELVEKVKPKKVND